MHRSKPKLEVKHGQFQYMPQKDRGAKSICCQPHRPRVFLLLDQKPMHRSPI